MLKINTSFALRNIFLFSVQHSYTENKRALIVLL